MPSESQGSGSLLAEGARGVGWLGTSQLLAQFLHIAVRLALARLLVPADFGLVAAAMAFTSAAAILVDFGVGTAMVQARTLSESQKTTAFWVILAMGTALTATFVVAAPLVGWFYRSYEVVPIARVLSLVFVLGGLDSFFSSLLRRELDFRAIGLSRVFGTIVAGAVGVSLAISGLGVWALVTNIVLTSALTSLALFWRVGWKPTLDFAHWEFGSLWTFSRPVILTRIVTYLGRNVDRILIGRFLGTGPLGLYSLSYQAVLVPLGYLARPVAMVSLPILSSIQADPRRCGRACRDGAAAIVLVAWPVATLIMLSAPFLVTPVLGEKWASAVPILQVLSVVGAIQASLALIPELLLALGRPGALLRLRTVTVLASVAAFVAGLPWGVLGVARGLLLATASTAVPILLTAARFSRVSFVELLSPLWRGMLSCFIMVLCWKALWTSFGPSLTPVEIGITGFVACAGYLLASRLLLPRAWGIVFEALGAVLKR